MQGTKFPYGVYLFKKTFKWKSFYFDCSFEILFHLKNSSHSQLSNTIPYK